MTPREPIWPPELFACACEHVVWHASAAAEMESCWQRFPPVQVGLRTTDPLMDEAWLDTVSAVLGRQSLYEGTIVWFLDLLEARRMIDCQLDRKPWDPVIMVRDMFPALGLLEYGVVSTHPWRHAIR